MLNHRWYTLRYSTEIIFVVLMTVFTCAGLFDFEQAVYGIRSLGADILAGSVTAYFYLFIIDKVLAKVEKRIIRYLKGARR